MVGGSQGAGGFRPAYRGQAAQPFSELWNRRPATLAEVESYDQAGIPKLARTLETKAVPALQIELAAPKTGKATTRRLREIPPEDLVACALNNKQAALPFIIHALRDAGIKVKTGLAQRLLREIGLKNAERIETIQRAADTLPGGRQQLHRRAFALFLRDTGDFSERSSQTVVQWLKETYPSAFREPLKDGQQPLAAATRGYGAKRRALVRACLDAGTKPRDVPGILFFPVADSKVLNMLLRAGADPHERHPVHGWTATEYYAIGICPTWPDEQLQCYRAANAYEHPSIKTYLASWLPNI